MCGAHIPLFPFLPSLSTVPLNITNFKENHEGALHPCFTDEEQNDRGGESEADDFAQFCLT